MLQILCAVLFSERMKDVNAAKRLARLVEHCTGNAKVMGSNPIQSLNFFRPFFQ